MKKCAKCKQLKKLTEFHNEHSTKDGLCCYCKQCESAYRKEWRKKHIESCKDTQKRVANEHTRILTGLKSNGCAICPSFDYLEFHHCEPDIKKFSIGHFFRYSNEEIVDELLKCILLCRSCHCKIDNRVNNTYKGKELL